MNSIQDVRAIAVQAASTYLNGTGATVGDVVVTADILAAYIEGGEEAARRTAWEKEPREGGSLNEYEQEVLSKAQTAGTQRNRADMEGILREARDEGASEVLLGQLQRMGDQTAKSGAVNTPKTSVASESNPPPQRRDPRAQRLLDAAIRSTSRRQVEMALHEAQGGGLVRAKVMDQGKEVHLNDALREAWQKLPKDEVKSLAAAKRATSSRSDLGL
jgi:hypothetical protein